MIDAYLFAMRDGIRSAGFGYGVPECEVMPSGKPPEACGNVYVSVYETTSRSAMRRNLDEYFSMALTLTMRISVPSGRVGDQLLASKLFRTSLGGQPSMNARMEQLRGYLHMNWNIMGQFDAYYVWTLNSANYNIARWTPSGTVYGFIEPAKYGGRGQPELVGGDWFTSDPTDVPCGLKCEMRFEDARRMQPQTLAVGPYG